MMTCTKHPNHEAAGVCHYSGRPYCAAELVEVDGHLVARDNLSQFVHSLNQLAFNTSDCDLLCSGGKGHTRGSWPAVAAKSVQVEQGGREPGEAHGGSRGAAGKSRTTAGVLALLLGCVGAHKFYLGERNQGLLRLALFWTAVPAIMGVFEGIRYLEMGDREFADKMRQARRLRGRTGPG